MQAVLLFSIIALVVYIITFFNEGREFKANNFFSIITCIFLVSFMITYVSNAYNPKNKINVISHDTIGFLAPNDSSELFKNDTKLILEIVKVKTIFKCNRAFIYDEGTESIRYYIKEKKVTQ